MPCDDVARSEIEREAIMAMLERERRSLTSSLLALALVATAIPFVAAPAFMAGLLLLRIASFLLTRGAVSRLERQFVRRQPTAGHRRALVLAMAGSGITHGLLLWPQPGGLANVANGTLILVPIVAMILISVTLAALPRGRDAMLASFWVTTAILVLAHPEIYSPWMIINTTLLVVGVRIYSHNTAQHIDDAARVTVENRILSEELADALAHAEFLSWRDPLTGLWNRRRLFEEREMRDVTRTRHLLTVDLDRFKAINDSFGHNAGDHVLIAAADAIRAAIAAHEAFAGQAFRLGGEEFLVILDDATMSEARGFAEWLRCRIAAIGPLMGPYPGIQVTASLGLSQWRAGERFDDALIRSDLACYAAKDRGRNCVRHAA